MGQMQQAGLLGFAHTTIVLSLTWFLCRWWRPLQSGNSSDVVRVATVIAIALTITAFLPVPSYSVHVARQVNRLLEAPMETPDHSVAESTSSTNHAHDSVSTLFASAIGLVSADVDVKFENDRAGHKRWSLLLIAVVMLTSVLLVLRQLLGLLSLAWLCRKSQPINDSLVLNELAFFQRQLGCRRVQLCVSEVLYSAATAGCLRPVILLPADWRTWSQAELRAVLAHELAHVKRRDFLWRLVGNLNASLHFYNPLANWLRNRLVLDQELAADDLASRVLGGNRAYAIALSSLAMRIDTATHPVPCPGLLSVSSSFLLRRIEMLRAQEGSQPRSRSRFSVRVTVALLVSAAIITVGLRASADNTLPISAKPRTIPRFDPTQLPLTQQGAFVIRPSALVASPEMMPYAAPIRQFWSELVKVAELPAIPLDEIDFLAGGLDVHVRSRDFRGRQASPHRWSVGASSNLLVLRTHKPQNFGAHIRRMFPAAEEQSGTNGPLFLLPHVPSLGPHRALLRILDKHTVAWSCSQAGKEWIRKNTRLSVNEKEWSAEWQSVDGGVFTLVVDRESIAWPESRNEWPSSLNQLIDQTRFLGVGVAPDPAIRLTCEVTGADGASTPQISRSIENLIAAVSSSLESHAEEGDTDLEVHPVTKFLGNWFRTALLTTPQRTDATVRVSGPLTFVTDDEKKVTQNTHSPTDGDDPSPAIILHLHVVEIYVDKAKQLGLDFQSIGPNRVSALQKVKPTEGARHLVDVLCQNPKMALPMIDVLRGHGVARTLAEPVITTASGRPARFRTESASQEIDLEMVPQVVGKRGQISMSVRLAETKEWKKFESTVKTSAGETVLLPLHNTNNESIQRFLIVRPEMVELAALGKLQPTKTPPGKLLRR